VILNFLIQTDRNQLIISHLKIIVQFRFKIAKLFFSFF